MQTRPGAFSAATRLWRGRRDPWIISAVTELWVGLVVALAAAILALVVPKAWERLQRWRRGGALTFSLEKDPSLTGPVVELFTEAQAPPADHPGPLEPRRAAWEASSDVVDLGWQVVRVNLRGHGPRPVVISQIRPVILSKSEPVSGWYFAPELGGGQPINLLIADLDENPPVARRWYEVEGEEGLEEQYAFRVTDTDVEYFQIEAFATSSSFTWGLDIMYDADGERGTLRIRDNRLRLTAEGPATNPFTDGPNGEWKEAPWGRGFSMSHAQYWREMPVRSAPR